MTTPKLARHIAKRFDGTSDAASKNTAATLRALADQVDSLTHAFELMNAECMRLAKERDEMREELTELKSSQVDRRTERRS